MYHLLKKEINSFLGSLIGYIVIVTLLSTCGLFLWVFKGGYNVVENGYATLESLFALAPWLYLFLVPAITMRMFAEEKKQGTMEVLLTKPVSDRKIVLAKFFAGIILVSISLLPTLIYFYSVYQLGNPVGSIDTGGTWGSYLGLLFLAAIYVAIGLFASSITDNQIVSFVTAMVLSFIFYMGFEFIGEAGIPYPLEKFLTWVSINEHYLAVSRGVVEFNDLVYFIGIKIIFLYATKLCLRKGQEKKKLVLKASMIPAILVAAYIVSGVSNFRLDLTSEKRYSVTEAGKNMVQRVEQPVEIELFLDGEMPAGFRRLQKAVVEKVDDLGAHASAKIRMRITDPYETATGTERSKFFEWLEKQGIKPYDVRNTTEKGVVTSRLYPGAIIKYKGQQLPLNFLKTSEGFSHEVNLNHSIEAIEFELVEAIRKLTREKKKQLAFLKGHGELNQWDVYDISNSLLNDFYVSRITTGQLIEGDKKYDIVICAGATIPFEEKDKIAIDQYLMQGGKLMWFIDPVRVSLDSLTRGYMTLAFPHDLNLDDMLFQYGVRLNTDLVQDVYCSRVMVNTAAFGTPENFTPEPWYYSPLLTPSDNHPISRNLNLVMSEFVSSIDTVSANASIKKSVILSSSPYARKVKTPSGISLENINNPPAKELFNIPFIPTGILLEGIFPSVYKNRMVENLGYSRQEVINESQPTKMMVFSDASIIANQVEYSAKGQRMFELGLDMVAQKTYGNKEFLLNAIHYLNDEEGIMQLRNRALKLRLLDKARLREQKRQWQVINVLLPVLLVSILGIVYNIRRRYKFSR